MGPDNRRKNRVSAVHICRRRDYGKLPFFSCFKKVVYGEKIEKKGIKLLV